MSLDVSMLQKIVVANKKATEPRVPIGKVKVITSPP
jgi:hypothetical protein